MGWEPVLRASSTLEARYLAKGPKCVPHLLGQDERDVLWIDASMHWRGHSLDALFAQVPIGGLGCFRHRFRQTVREEAEFSASLPLYRDQPILGQATQYGEIDTLYEAGILVWRGAQQTVGVRWAAEMLAWSNQDQLSLPVAARACGVAITELAPGSVVNNPWFHYIHHRRDDYR
jgi:hypothetical protein